MPEDIFNLLAMNHSATIDIALDLRMARMLPVETYSRIKESRAHSAALVVKEWYHTATDRARNTFRALLEKKVCHRLQWESQTDDSSSGNEPNIATHKGNTSPLTGAGAGMNFPSAIPVMKYNHGPPEITCIFHLTGYLLPCIESPVIYQTQEVLSVAKEATADDNTCSICMDAPRDTALTPCGHYSYCEDCARNVLIAKGGCPICRKCVTGWLRIYP